MSTNLIDATKTGSLNVYKYEMPDVSRATSVGTGEVTTDIPDSATALPGVTFKATRVADIVKSDGTIDTTYYASNSTALPTPPEASNMTAIETYTAVTDSTGLAQFSNLPLDTYKESKAEVKSLIESIQLNNLILNYYPDHPFWVVCFYMLVELSLLLCFVS